MYITLDITLHYYLCIKDIVQQNSRFELVNKYYSILFQVHVIELGPYQTGNFAPRNTYDQIHFGELPDQYDFPVALHVRTFLCPYSKRGEGDLDLSQFVCNSKMG